MRFFAICGKMGSGKTTLGRSRFNPDTEPKVSMAATLKKCVARLYDAHVELLDSQYFKQWWLPLEITPAHLDIIISHFGEPPDRCMVEEFIKNAPTPKSPRELLQFVGTDIVRNHFGLNRHTELAVARIKDLAGQNLTAAWSDDIRFVNEWEAVEGAVDELIGIYLTNGDNNPSNNNHVSETEMEQLKEKCAFVGDREDFTWDLFF